MHPSTPENSPARQLADGVKGIPGSLFKKFVELIELVLRKAGLRGMRYSFLAHERQAVEGVLAHDKSHQPCITDQGSAQRFIDRFGYVEGWGWLHWNRASRKWESETAPTAGAAQ